VGEGRLGFGVESSSARQGLWKGREGGVVAFGMGIRLCPLYYESSSARQHGMNAGRRRMRNG
jgi:hypothetical protein